MLTCAAQLCSSHGDVKEKESREKGFFFGDFNPDLLTPPAVQYGLLCAQSAYLAGANPAHYQALCFVLVKYNIL